MALSSTANKVMARMKLASGPAMTTRARTQTGLKWKMRRSAPTPCCSWMRCFISARLLASGTEELASASPAKRT